MRPWSGVAGNVVTKLITGPRFLRFLEVRLLPKGDELGPSPLGPNQRWINRALSNSAIVVHVNCVVLERFNCKSGLFARLESARRN